MIELLPGVRRIEALGDSLERVPNTLQALQDAARAKGIELVIQTVGTPEEIAPAIDAAKASDAAGLNVLAMPLFYANRRITFERTAALRLPTIYQWPEMVRQGGLVAYGPSVVQIYRQQMARLLARLLRGTKPADLPVEQPTKFELVVNLNTAQALRLTVPQSLLAGADEVIERPQAYDCTASYRCISRAPSVSVATAWAMMRSMIADAAGISLTRSTLSPAQTTRVAKSSAAVAK